MREQGISRVTRTKQQARANYDRISRWFDLLEGIAERKAREVGLRKLGVNEGEAALEIGFGTGHGLLAIASLVGDSGKVYGIDISLGMLDITRARIRKARLSSRVELIYGDAENLPFKAASFDSIFMSSVLELFDTPEIPSVLRECQRVLRGGGRIGVVALSEKGSPGLMRKLYEWGHRQLPSLLDCRPIFVQKALESAGFQIVDAQEVLMWRLPVEVVLAKRGQSI